MNVVYLIKYPPFFLAPRYSIKPRLIKFFRVRDIVGILTSNIEDNSLVLTPGVSSKI